MFSKSKPKSIATSNALSPDAVLLNEVLDAINAYIVKNKAKLIKNTASNKLVIDQITNAIYCYAGQKVPQKLLYCVRVWLEANNYGTRTFETEKEIQTRFETNIPHYNPGFFAITSLENLLSKHPLMFTPLKTIRQSHTAFAALITEINVFLASIQKLSSKFKRNLSGILNKNRVETVYKALEIKNTTITNIEAPLTTPILPYDILNNIFYYLDMPKDQNAFKRTCRLFYHSATDENSKWLHKILQEFPHLSGNALKQALQDNGAYEKTYIEEQKKHLLEELKSPDSPKLIYCALMLPTSIATYNENLKIYNYHPVRVLNARVYSSEDLNLFIAKNLTSVDINLAGNTYPEFRKGECFVVGINLSTNELKQFDEDYHFDARERKARVLAAIKTADLRKKIVSVSYMENTDEIKTVPVRFNGECFEEIPLTIENNNNNNNMYNKHA